MTHWDADSRQLERNLVHVLEALRQEASRRVLPSLAAVRRWHTDTHRNLDMPHQGYVGTFRGEPGLEKVQVQVGGVFAVPAHEVASALQPFETTLQSVIGRLDDLIPVGAEPNADQLVAILQICAWPHRPTVG